MTTEHLELALSRYRRLTVALDQLDPEKHMSQMDNHYLAMGAEITRLQAQVDVLAASLNGALDYASDRLRLSSTGRALVAKARAALAAAGR